MIGIVTMPFLHGGFGHLLSNTIPLSILLVVLGLSRAHSWVIVAGIALLSGILLWLLGRYADHIGASGLVYGLALYLIVAGLLEKRIVSMLIAIGVLFLFGTTLIWGVLPIGNRGVSWDGHLMGAIAGGVIAWGGTSLGGKEKKEAD